MAPERGQWRVRHLRLSVGDRRVFRPVHPGHADGLRRLARRFPRARGLHRDLSRGGGAAATARTALRARHHLRSVRAPDARSPAQPEAACDLRRWVRRFVQLPRHVHLHQLSSRGTAVQPIAGLPRLDLLCLSDRFGGGAVDRTGDRAVRAEDPGARRARPVGHRPAGHARSLDRRDHRGPRDLLHMRHSHPGVVDRLCRDHGQDRHLGGGGALCDIVLRRRYVRRLPSGTGLRGRRLAVLGLADRRDDWGAGLDRCDRLAKFRIESKAQECPSVQDSATGARPTRP